MLIKLNTNGNTTFKSIKNIPIIIFVVFIYIYINKIDYINLIIYRNSFCIVFSEHFILKHLLQIQ